MGCLELHVRLVRNIKPARGKLRLMVVASKGMKINAWPARPRLRLTCTEVCTAQRYYITVLCSSDSIMVTSDGYMMALRQ